PETTAPESPASSARLAMPAQPVPVPVDAVLPDDDLPPPPPEEPYFDAPPEDAGPVRTTAPARSRTPERPQASATTPVASEAVATTLEPTSAAEPAPAAEPPPAAEPVPVPASEPARAAAAAPSLTIEAVSARWADIRAAVSSRQVGGMSGKILAPMLSAATVQAVGDGTVVLGHSDSGLVGRLSDPTRLEMFNEIFSQIFGGSWQVQVVHAAPGASPATSNRSPRQPAPVKRQEFTRPSRVGQAADRRRAVDDGPPPPEPPPEPEEPWPAEPKPDEELTDAERDEMVATAHDGTPDKRLDPDQIALELLKSELGARPVDGGSAPF
ncbi:MAG: DNA polymerase III subunit gamma/tau, partial [Gordonia sp. (in: high G+C Gram-positive bacteria)]